MNKARAILYASFIVFMLNFITAVYYDRSDQAFRSVSSAFVVTLLVVLRKYANTPYIVRFLMRPFCNDYIVSFLALFLAVHMSVVCTPIFAIDLIHDYHCDIVSHFLGGFSVWLVVLGEVSQLNLPDKKNLLLSLLVFAVLAIFWEAIENSIVAVPETVANKFQDIVVDFMGLVVSHRLVVGKVINISSVSSS